MRAVLLGVTLLVFPACSAAARDAGCRIEQQGRVVLDQRCDFQPDGRNGSFVLASRAAAAELVPGIDMITVSIIEPGLAEVRGLTSGGINSRWGSARRSQRDKACWQGDDFRICVR